jgi:hypothetical protein
LSGLATNAAPLKIAVLMIICRLQQGAQS